ncbi:uncharacterized protein [Epargyreus clarus]|uniref:uncharacterized protein n=1 Tax=Epargyreus clarus TaxID=520877 RepID=UPI003C2E0879
MYFDGIHNMQSAFIFPAIKKDNFVFWPNATVPFYINPNHFDHEQSLSIMTSLSLFAFKTCIKFAPVMAEPSAEEHVMVFQNPGALWECSWTTDGHSIDEPHKINLGFECLKSPKMEMTIMRALGFPFEHNRASRDLFIDVQYENIQPAAIELFTKDTKLPVELRNLPYDVHSVMHFGDRDFSKNGHRTIIIKDRNLKQNRVGLSEIDLRKIEIVYGPECQNRDRQEKIDLCQIYPGVARKKRQVDINLRVNRNITPPPNKNLSDHVLNIINELGIRKEIEDVIEEVYKTVSVAVDNARAKHCNSTKEASQQRALRSHKDIIGSSTSDTSVADIIDVVAKFSQSFVADAIANLTHFCVTMDAVDAYERTSCHFGSEDPRCPLYYRSTKSGNGKYYTQHRPVHYLSTKHVGHRTEYHYGRSGNNTDDMNITAVNATRKKREAHRENDDFKMIDLEDSNTSLRKDKDIFNKTKESLRSVTSVQRVKTGHYAPFRRFKEKRFRIYSRKDKLKENRSQEMVTRQKKIPKDDIEESGSEKQHEDSPKPQEKKYRNRPMPRDSDIPKTVPLSKSNKEFYEDRKWPHGIVRYVITEYDEYDLHYLRARLRAVNAILMNKTCVRLKELSENDAKMHDDYLVLDVSPDYVTGRVGGRQVFGSVELFKGVSHKQHTAMMVMAMLGFYFEVARHDRDEHVVVHVRHIRPDKLHHFEKIRSDATLALPYDYKSATHPSWQFWRKIGKKGISSVATFKDKDPDGSIMRSFGQNNQLLSDLDIIKINSVYGVHCFKKKLRDNV